MNNYMLADVATRQTKLDFAVGQPAHTKGSVTAISRETGDATAYEVKVALRRVIASDVIRLDDEDAMCDLFTRLNNTFTEWRNDALNQAPLTNGATKLVESGVSEVSFTRAGESGVEVVNLTRTKDEIDRGLPKGSLQGDRQ